MNFDTLHSQYLLAVSRNDRATQEAVIKALHKLARTSGPIPAWASALGIEPPGERAPPAKKPQPETWAGVLAILAGPNSPIAAAPKAWAAVAAELGTAPLTLFAVPVSDFEQRSATSLVWQLVAAAAAFESAIPTLGANESLAHVQWRADLASVNALVADVDGGASAGATAQQLTERIATAKRSASSLATGKAALLNALRVPPEPERDVAFNAALGAVKLFFT